MALRCDTLVIEGRGARHTAIDGVSLTADEGDIVGVVGPAHAGKSVLLGALAGARPCTRGSIALDGTPVRCPAARRHIGYATDPPVLPSELTGLEWLTYLAAHSARGPADRLRLVRWAVEIAGIGGVARRRLRGYDRARAQRLAFAAAAVAGSRLVVLDETLTGMESMAARELRSAAQHMASEGRIVIIAARDVGVVERVATRALVLSRGQVAADVHMAALVQERVVELALRGGGLAGAPQLLALYPGSVRTGEGVAIPLAGGLSCEAVLAACRGRRIPVAGTRLRYRMLEDILVVAGRVQQGGHGGSR